MKAETKQTIIMALVFTLLLLSDFIVNTVVSILN